MKHARISIGCLFLPLFFNPCLAEDAWIHFSPTNPTSESFLTYTLDADGGCQDYSNGYLIDNEHNVIKMSAVSGADFATCPGPLVQLLGYLSPRVYQVEVYKYDYQNDGELFLPEKLVLTTELNIESPMRVAHHESPAEGSVQSGVGVIRGWACDAVEITVTIDGERRIAAHGLSRRDTENICGDSDNGYAMLVNWNLLGEGTHTMHVSYSNKTGYSPLGTIVQDLQFTVVTMDEDYYTGLEKNIEVQDFPEPGKSVTVEWSKVDQNFKITDYHR